MITYFRENFNSYFDSASYNEDICSIDFLLVSCPKCHHHGCLIHHAYYPRTIKLADHSIRIRILRVKCNECGSTHAVVPSFVVPYSQISVDIQIKTCFEFSSDTAEEIVSSNPDIDESNLRYIIRNYRKYWEQRIISFSVPVDTHLTEFCFRYFSKQFMQLKNIHNYFFIHPHKIASV